MTVSDLSAPHKHGSLDGSIISSINKAIETPKYAPEQINYTIQLTDTIEEILIGGNKIRKQLIKREKTYGHHGNKLRKLWKKFLDENLNSNCLSPNAVRWLTLSQI